MTNVFPELDGVTRKISALKLCRTSLFYRTISVLCPNWTKSVISRFNANN